MNNLLNPISIKKKILFILYVSYAWIPLRRRVIKEYKNRKWHMQSSSIRRQNIGYETYEINRLLPPLDYILKFYFTLSTGTHILNALISSIFIINGGLKVRSDSYLSLLKCHSHRVMIHDFLDQELILWIGCALSWLHVIWRSLMLIYERELMLDTWLFLLVDKEDLQKLSDPELALKVYRRDSSLDLIQRILFYRMGNSCDKNLKFVLKPGRSERDRAIFDCKVKVCIKLAVVITLTTLLVSAPFGFYAFFTNLDFYYPNCNTEGFGLAFLNRFIGSLNLSLITLFDSCLGMFVPVMTSLTMARDLMVYWSHIEPKLHWLAETLEINNNFINSDQSQSSYSLRYDETIMTKSNRRHQKLSKKILELQSLLGDFFGQVQRADQFTSILLGYLFGIWLASHTIITLARTRDNNRNTAIVTACAQFIFFMMLIVLSYLILLLERKTGPAYKVLCSIMANDPSLDKTRWAAMLKYYNVKPRYAFTIMHSKVFTLGLFIKTFSYTFTFAWFIESVRSSRY